MTIPRLNTERLEMIIHRSRDRNEDLSFGLYEKSVQLKVDGQPYLRFGSRQGEHKEILMEFLYECKRAGEPVVSQEDLEGIKNGKPPLKLGRYEVVGMGEVRIFPDENKMVFSGDSFGYNLEINPKHLKQIKKYLKNWKLLTKDLE